MSDSANSNLPMGTTTQDLDLASGDLIQCAFCGKLCDPDETDEPLCQKCQRDMEGGEER